MTDNPDNHQVARFRLRIGGRDRMQVQENSPTLQRVLAVCAVLTILGVLGLVTAIIWMELDPNFWWAVVGGALVFFSIVDRME